MFQNLLFFTAEIAENAEISLAINKMPLIYEIKGIKE